MEEYIIDYNILDYNLYRQRLKKIQSNKNNKFEVTKLNDLGYTSCGFPIEHYKIGNGPIHVTYMGGMHGNELIGVDFVTQLMNNLAKGTGKFKYFNPNIFTIDFIPCQNPEGFYTTMFYVNKILNNMNLDEKERFCRKYYEAYKKDDMLVIKINEIISNLISKFKIDYASNKLCEQFFCLNHNKEITKESLFIFFKLFNLEDNKMIKKSINDEWVNKFGNVKKIDNKHYHTIIMNDVSIDDFPEIDEQHKKLKSKLRKIYKNNFFLPGTLTDFFANGDGVNLNDNNPYFFEYFKEKIKKEKIVYGNLRNNHIIKSINGPLGVPNINMNQKFTFCLENKAIIKYLKKQRQCNEYYALFNCHSAGGALYAYPIKYDYKNIENNHQIELIFKINDIIAKKYVEKVGNVYKEETEKYNPYIIMDRPDVITGFGDLLRKNYPASFILELSKIGGNPIAYYSDLKGNYRLTMISNFEAMITTLETINNIKEMYNKVRDINSDEI